MQGGQEPNFLDRRRRKILTSIKLKEEKGAETSWGRELIGLCLCRVIGNFGERKN